MKKHLHPRLEQVLTKMYVEDKLEYYVSFYGFVDFYEDPTCDTMWAGMRNLRLAFGYNKKFLEKQTDQQLKYLLIHELYHMLFRHGKRTTEEHDRNLSWVSKDMIINYLIDTHYSAYVKPINDPPPAYKLASRPVYHKEDFEDPRLALSLLRQGSKPGDESGCVIDPEYLELVKKGEAALVWEQLYKFLKEKQKDGGKPSFDEHENLSEEQEELLKRVVKEVSEKAKQMSQGRGGMPRHVGEHLELLLKTSKTNNIREIARATAALRGFVKEPSYRRPNRKVEGVKGHKRTGHAITVLHDWSGSMYGRHERVLSEIFRDGYELMFVGGDTGVMHVQKVTRKEQLKTIVQQGDGTELMPSIQQIAADSKLNRNPLLILTDGETDTLDFTSFPQKVLILSVNKECPVVGRPVKQILIGDGV